MTVKLLAVDYDKPKERDAFSPGDVLSGKVTLVTSKEMKAQCFTVKAKGRAKVTWCEREGESGGLHGDKKRYFHLEHVILQDKNRGDGWYHCLHGVERQSVCVEHRNWHRFFPWKKKKTGSEIISAGRNVYPFTFVIPNMCVSHLKLSISHKLVKWSRFSVPCRDMPSSYEGKWGKVTYSLRAKLTQSIWLVHKAAIDFPFLTKSEFPFASKTEMMIIGLKVWTRFSLKQMLVIDIKCQFVVFDVTGTAACNQDFILRFWQDYN